MRSLVDTDHVLDRGLVDIRKQYQVPEGFAEEVLGAASAAAQRGPVAGPEQGDDSRVDLTGWPFVTLDPPTSTDLDQAFTIERRTGAARSGDGDLLLHYAIADVGAFVQPGDELDREAWRRGTTLYLPDGKAGLYPPQLAEGAASLLPDGERPAVVFHVALAPDGAARLEGVERAIIRSQAKLAYTTAGADDLPAEFEEFARRVAVAEEARGAGRIEAPEQLVERDDGHYRLSLRPRLLNEQHNAALSLATNLAVADAMQAAGVGLFRVMASPDERAVGRLRQTARAFRLDWPRDQNLDQFARTLHGDDPRHAAFMLAARRAGGGAEYQTYRAGEVPWHAAMAATYAHATAPLRRLADRYVVELSLALAAGTAVAPHLAAALPELPAAMAAADRLGNAIEREVIDLAEAVMLHGREGDSFDAVVTDHDDDGARIQLCEPAVRARVDAKRVAPGDEIRVKLVAADPDARRVQFQRVG